MSQSRNQSAHVRRWLYKVSDQTAVMVEPEDRDMVIAAVTILKMRQPWVHSYEFMTWGLVAISDSHLYLMAGSVPNDMFVLQSIYHMIDPAFKEEQCDIS